MSKFCKEINLILQKLKNGDNSKQKELYDATFNHLKVIALKYAADKNDYEDILFEAYIRAFRYIKNFDSTKDGYNWLCKIVQNVAIDFNANNEQCLSIDEVEIKELFENIDDTISNKDLILREIQKLSESDKEIMYLRFWEDKTISQIAEKLDRQRSYIHKRIIILIGKIKNNLSI